VPYVKSIPIRTTVNRSIAYVLNPDKTEDLLLVSGINVVADRKLAYQQFKNIYQSFHVFDQQLKTKAKKKKIILAHHFVQSFKPGEVTPDIAQKIGYEWAKKVFGDNHQVVIATHNDKGHIHNHFIVNAYGFNGKKFYSNKSSLNRLREISDEICRSYNIQPIQGNKRKNVHYKEWLEMKKGESWKQKIRLAIDRAVIRANSLDEMLSLLSSEGYEIKRGKYISIRPPNLERFVRTKTLGIEYTEEGLIFRIQNKQLESISQFGNHFYGAQKPSDNHQRKYKGIQLKYVSTIRLLADLILQGKKLPRKYDRKKPYSINNDYDVYKLASHLRYLNEHDISTEEQLQQKFEEVKTVYTDTKKNIDRLTELMERMDGVIQNASIYFKLSEKKSISSSEKLQLSIARSIIEKYNIRQKEELVKLTNQVVLYNKQKTELLKKFHELEQNYKTIKDVFDTYNKIRKDAYLDRGEDVTR